jgi:hypothetical protein
VLIEEEKLQISDDDSFVLKGSIGRMSIKKSERPDMNKYFVERNEAEFDELLDPEISSGNEDEDEEAKQLIPSINVEELYREFYDPEPIEERSLGEL